MREILARFPHLSIAVVGDGMTDLYHFGKCTKLSQEAPIPVFVQDSSETRPGGASNVAANLEALGVKVHDMSEHTSTKVRYVAGHYQMFRVDHDFPWKPTTVYVKSLIERLFLIDALDAIVLSDYAKGTCSDAVCSAVISFASARKIPVIVDPKGDSWWKYSGATVICPNQAEYANAKEGPKFDVLEKRGAEGIQIHHAGGLKGISMPATARAVFDVAGCGDVVVACAAAVLAASGDLETAAIIGNIAAGWAAEKVGTVAVPYDVLVQLVGEYTQTSHSP